MKRILIPATASLLAVCLTLSALADGYVRTAHAVAKAGQTTLVICGQDGASTVTLDRDGNPVAPATCAHCADCTVVPAPVPASAVQTVQRMEAQAPDAPAARTDRPAPAPVLYTPRGPPASETA